MIKFSTLSRKRNTYRPIGLNLFRSVLSILLLFFLVSCGSKKPRVVTTKKQAKKHRVQRNTTENTKVTTVDELYSETAEPLTVDDNSNSTLNNVIANARAYKGTRYKYGGSSKSGMDCSGLIHIAFKESGTSVPRTSRSLKSATKEIPLKEVQKGDLLFFATGARNRVNHVGLVTNVTPAEITFIHATTSKGVIESTLNEIYWVNAFLSAGRLR